MATQRIACMGANMQGLGHPEAARAVLRHVLDLRQ